MFLFSDKKKVISNRNDKEAKKVVAPYKATREGSWGGGCLKKVEEVWCSTKERGYHEREWVFRKSPMMR